MVDFLGNTVILGDEVIYSSLDENNLQYGKVVFIEGPSSVRIINFFTGMPVTRSESQISKVH
jgi:hypothetical protein